MSGQMMRKISTDGLARLATTLSADKTESKRTHNVANNPSLHRKTVNALTYIKTKLNQEVGL